MHTTCTLSSNSGCISNWRLIAALIVSIIRLSSPYYVAFSFQPEITIRSTSFTSSCRYHHHHHQCRHYSVLRYLRQEPESEPCHENTSEVTDPWTTATVDYSAANEYIKAHYGNHPMLQSSSWTHPSPSYFLRGNSGDDKVTESIYDARELRILEETKSTQTASKNIDDVLFCHRDLLKKYGITLVDSPTKMMDWKNKKQIEDIYIQELEKILPSLFSSEIIMHCFWNPMLRGESHKLSSPRHQNDGDGQQQESDDDKYSIPIPTSNVASAVHIDTDVGAYESLDDFLAIIETNQVKRRRQDIMSFDRKEYQNSNIEGTKALRCSQFLAQYQLRCTCHDQTSRDTIDPIRRQWQ